MISPNENSLKTYDLMSIFQLELLTCVFAPKIYNVSLMVNDIKDMNEQAKYWVGILDIAGIVSSDFGGNV